MLSFRTKKIVLTFNMDNPFQNECYEFLMGLEDTSSKGHSKKKFILSALVHERERLDAEGIGGRAALIEFCKGIKVGNDGITYRGSPVSSQKRVKAPAAKPKENVSPEEMAKYKEVQKMADKAKVTLDFADAFEFAEFYREHPEDIEGFLAGDLESGLIDGDEAEDIEEIIPEFPEPDALIVAAWESKHGTGGNGS